ncbi:MAG: trehalose-6-phosphate synthase [Actinomycetota bacterium]
MTASRPVVLVSNRGPVSFEHGDDGEVTSRRGAGGLVSGLGPLVVDTDTVWVAAAMTAADREVAAGGVIEAEGFRVLGVDIPPDRYRMAYDVIANATLWFAYHGMFDRPHRPVLDRRWREAWAAYRELNESFAEVVASAAPPDAVVLVQDHHLALLGGMLAGPRPDVSSVHFTHTPFPGPDDLRVLPDDVAVELLEGMAGHHACGFHTDRWRRAFDASCAAVLDRRPTSFVSPLSSDPDDIAGVAGSDAGRAARAELDDLLGDRAFIVRVDRIELSKNLLRGFAAFADLLEHRPEWRERVVFGAFVYPSREGLAEYLAYRQQVERAAESINERFGTEEWEPVVLDTSDDFPRSVAALTRSDVLLVNPIRDGLNLVAKEGALVNDRDGVLCLSPEAGAWAELGEVSVPVHPYDVAGTADGLHRALSMPADERRAQAEARRAIVAGRTPADWLADQVAAAQTSG